MDGHYGYWNNQPDYWYGKEDGYYGEQLRLKNNGNGKLEIYFIGNFECYINGNIVSFIHEWGDGSSGYYIYNVDIDDQKIINDDELLAILKVDKEQIIEEARQKSGVMELLPEYFNDDEDAIEVNGFYLNDEGHLCCRIFYFTGVGSGYAEFLYDTVTKFKMEYYPILSKVKVAHENVDEGLSEEDTMTNEEPTTEISEEKNEVFDSDVQNLIESETNESRDEKIVFENDKLVLKTINYEDYALWWVYNDEPEIHLIENDQKLVVEWYGGNITVNEYSDYFYLNDNILSIVDNGGEAGGAWYDVFNIDIDLKQILSNEDILKLAGQNAKEMEEYVKNVGRSVINEKIEEDREYIEQYEYFQEKIKLVFEEFDEYFDNFYSSIEFFLGDNNHLCYAIRISDPVSNIMGAGSDSAYYLYDTISNQIIAYHHN